MGSSPTNSSGSISLGNVLREEQMWRRMFNDNTFYPCQFSYKRIGLATFLIVFSIQPKAKTVSQKKETIQMEQLHETLFFRSQTSRMQLGRKRTRGLPVGLIRQRKAKTEVRPLQVIHFTYIR